MMKYYSAQPHQRDVVCDVSIHSPHQSQCCTVEDCHENEGHSSGVEWRPASVQRQDVDGYIEGRAHHRTQDLNHRDKGEQSTCIRGGEGRANTTLHSLVRRNEH